ncbi:hypothetical protein ACOMHN_041265 [Nucella lapillus]
MADQQTTNGAQDKEQDVTVTQDEEMTAIAEAEEGEAEAEQGAQEAQETEAEPQEEAEQEAGETEEGAVEEEAQQEAQEEEVQEEEVQETEVQEEEVQETEADITEAAVAEEEQEQAQDMIQEEADADAEPEPEPEPQEPEPNQEAEEGQVQEEPEAEEPQEPEMEQETEPELAGLQDPEQEVENEAEPEVAQEEEVEAEQEAELELEQEAEELTEEEEQTFQSLFDMLATEDGRVNRQGVKHLFRYMGQLVNEHIITTYFQQADRDGDALLDFKEFCSLYRKNRQSDDRRKEELLESVNTLFPVNGGPQDSISLDQVSKKMKGWRVTRPGLVSETSFLQDEEIDSVLHDMDLNGDGSITRQEFVEFLCSTMND